MFQRCFIVNFTSRFSCFAKFFLLIVLYALKFFLYRFHNEQQKSIYSTQDTGMNIPHKKNTERENEKMKLQILQ